MTGNHGTIFISTGSSLSLWLFKADQYGVFYIECGTYITFLMGGSVICNNTYSGSGYEFLYVTGTSLFEFSISDSIIQGQYFGDPNVEYLNSTVNNNTG